MKFSMVCVLSVISLLSHPTISEAGQYQYAPGVAVYPGGDGDIPFRDDGSNTTDPDFSGLSGAQRGEIIDSMRAHDLEMAERIMQGTPVLNQILVESNKVYQIQKEILRSGKIKTRINFSKIREAVASLTAEEIQALNDYKSADLMGLRPAVVDMATGYMTEGERRIQRRSIDAEFTNILIETLKAQARSCKRTVKHTFVQVRP